jgi:hypothetical protein
MKIEGGCLCGQVRYQAETEPFFTACCHCKNCQKQSGTAFSVVVGLPEAALQIDGDMTTYDDTADSGGRVLRKFCPKCGSAILSAAAGRPGMVILKAGTLDDTSWLDPKVHVWTESAMACTQIPEGAMAFAKNPPG